MGDDPTTFIIERKGLVISDWLNVKRLMFNVEKQEFRV